MYNQDVCHMQKNTFSEETWKSAIVGTVVSYINCFSRVLCISHFYGFVTRMGSERDDEFTIFVVLWWHFDDRIFNSFRICADDVSCILFGITNHKIGRRKHKRTVPYPKNSIQDE